MEVAGKEQRPRDPEVKATSASRIRPGVQASRSDADVCVRLRRFDLVIYVEKVNPATLPLEGR